MAARILLGLIVLALLIAKSLTQQLDHDENQFIAGAALIARQGLLPYRDFATFHTPYLLFLYAVVFRMSDWLLLSARIVSAVCSFLMLIGLWCISNNAARSTSGDGIKQDWRDLGSLVVTILMANRLFMHTSGLAWNHDVPILLTVIAFLAIRKTNRETGSAVWSFAAGACLGLATGTRSTFAPTLLAAGGVIILMRASSKKTVLRNLSCLFAGALMALAPCLVLVALAPRQFWFGNVMYPFLNLEWRQAQGAVHAISLVSKARFIVGDMLLKQPTILSILLLFGFAVVQMVRAPRWELQSWRDAMCAALLTGALFVGAIVPTPAFLPYFYAPVPFMILTIVYVATASSDSRAAQWRRWLRIAALISIPAGLFVYGRASWSALNGRLIVADVHQLGVRIAARAQGKRVLSLAPIFPLEGGATIYPQFATGPFAFRVANLLPESREASLSVADADDLEELIHSSPPGLIVLQGETRLERPLEAAAKRHGIPVLHVLVEGQVR